MEKAIKRAIEGGWKKDGKGSVEIYKGAVYIFGERIIVEKVLLDTLFWQALGKAEGWHYCRFHSFNGSESEAEMCQDCLHDEWVKKWHSFIDHLADGGNIDEFFDNLLK